MIAKVGNVSISEGELNHWISLEATFAEKKSGVKVTKPLIIDPPTYAACVAGLKSTPAKPAGTRQTKAPTTPPSSAALKGQCQTQYEQLRPSVLEHLIFVDWVFGEASNLGLKTSASEIQHQVEATKQSFEKQHGGYQKFLEQSGTTSSDMLRQITFSQLEGKLSQKVSNEVMAKASSQGVSHGQIDSYYKEHLSTYEHPETRDIQVLLTEKLPAALKAKREISSGKSFASVEKRVSIYPTEQIKKAGGSLPGVVRKKYETIKHSTPGASTPSDEKIYEEAVFSAKEHVLTGPIKTSEAYYLILVNKIKKQEPTETLAQVEGAIKQTLTKSRGEQMFAGFNESLQKRWKARTNCAKSFVISYCEQFVPHKEMSLAEQSRMHGREAEAMKKQQERAIKLSSPAIIKPSILAMEHNAQPQFARRYTCDGANSSPPFTWSNLPQSTAELVLAVQQTTNRGARSYIWVVGGINPSLHGIAAGSLPLGAVVGRNGSGKAKWGGICPPHGAEYGYFITLIALSKKLELKPGFDLRRAGNSLEKARLGVGFSLASYKRR